MIFLSVIIPTYNRRDSLLRTLQALERQTFSNDQFEVVVISDGSTDGTAAAVRQFQPAYRLRFTEQPNQGPSVARNKGAQLADAPIVVYLDDDIEPCADFLAVHASAHEHDLRMVLIGPQTGPMNERMPAWIAWEHTMLQKQYRNFTNGVWSTGPNNLYSGNFSLRREHLLAVGGFNAQFTRQEDVELGFRLEKHGLHFHFNPCADGIHRPTRTFAAWYKTPFEYGRRDVQMSRDLGEASVLSLARRHFKERNRLTRSLARICIGRGPLESAVMTVGCLGVQYGGRKMALPICSLLFNLRYLQGMCRELGGRKQLWQFILQ
jgi:glycosyltransferase involved in cell wall biosynthesis